MKPRGHRGTKLWVLVAPWYGKRSYNYEEKLLSFGRFRTVEKGSFPPQITGLYHGEVEYSERVPLKRKFNYWTKKLTSPRLMLKNFPSMALKTELTFRLTHSAQAEIKKCKGIDGYLMSHSPRVINQARALLYREQIRQVYVREREEAFRRREEMIHDFVQMRVKELNPAAVNPFWEVHGRRTLFAPVKSRSKVCSGPRNPDDGAPRETGVHEDEAESSAEAFAKQ